MQNDDEIPGWFDFADIYDQAVAEAEDGDTLVEIGSWMGRSAVYMARAIQESGKRLRFVCVDTWEGTPGTRLEAIAARYGGDVFAEFMANIRAADVEDLICPLRMPSLRAVKWCADKGARFVFLDGDHSLEAVRDDIRAWLTKVKPGGIIAGHDYDRRSTVRQAVLERFGSRVEERPPRSWLVRVDEVRARVDQGKKLCLALNVKNESAVIDRCIEAAAPHVDGVVCTDTGSTDDTMQRVREACDRVGTHLHLRERPWENFADSQTELLREAREDGYRYAWIVDADEEIVQTEQRSHELTADGYDVCRLHAGDWEVWTTRIFKLELDWRYEGVRHAAPTLPLGETEERGRLRGLEVINHRDGVHGTQAQEEQRARFRRDVVHFLERITTGHCSERDWYYLAQSAHDAGQRELAIWAYGRRAGMAGGFAEERYLSALQIARYTGAVADYERATRIRPKRAEAWVELARIHRLGDRWHEALDAAQSALQAATHQLDQGDRFLVQRSAHTWRPRLELELTRWLFGDQKSLQRILLLWEIYKHPEIWREFERCRTESALGAQRDQGSSAAYGSSADDCISS